MQRFSSDMEYGSYMQERFSRGAAERIVFKLMRVREQVG